MRHPSCWTRRRKQRTGAVISDDEDFQNFDLPTTSLSAITESPPVERVTRNDANISTSSLGAARRKRRTGVVMSDDEDFDDLDLPTMNAITERQPVKRVTRDDPNTPTLSPRAAMVSTIPLAPTASASPTTGIARMSTTIPAPISLTTGVIRTTAAASLIQGPEGNSVVMATAASSTGQPMLISREALLPLGPQTAGTSGLSQLDKLLGLDEMTHFQPFSGDSLSWVGLDFNFQSTDPNFLDLELSCMDSSEQDIDPSQPGYNIPVVPSDAGQSGLDAEDEMTYWLTKWMQAQSFAAVPEEQDGAHSDRNIGVPSIMTGGVTLTSQSGSTALEDAPSEDPLGDAPLDAAEEDVPVINTEEETPQGSSGANKENVRPTRGRRPLVARDLGGDAVEAEIVLRSLDLGEDYLRCVEKWKEFEMCTTVSEVSYASIFVDETDEFNRVVYLLPNVHLPYRLSSKINFGQRSLIFRSRTKRFSSAKPCVGGIRFSQSGGDLRPRRPPGSFPLLTSKVILGSSERRGRVVWCGFCTSFDGGEHWLRSQVMTLSSGTHSLQTSHRVSLPCWRVITPLIGPDQSAKMRRTRGLIVVPSASVLNIRFTCHCFFSSISHVCLTL